jgi:hypothetical protein
MTRGFACLSSPSSALRRESPIAAGFDPSTFTAQSLLLQLGKLLADTADLFVDRLRFRKLRLTVATRSPLGRLCLVADSEETELSIPMPSVVTEKNQSLTSATLLGRDSVPGSVGQLGVRYSHSGMLILEVSVKCENGYRKAQDD